MNGLDWFFLFLFFGLDFWAYGINRDPVWFGYFTRTNYVTSGFLRVGFDNFPKVLARVKLAKFQ